MQTTVRFPRLKRLLAELQRRKVTRVAASYLVAAWIVLQIAGSIENALTLPGSFDTIALVVLALGFPVAIVLAWIYQITPDGIERTVGSADGEPSPPGAIAWILFAMVVVIDRKSTRLNSSHQ